MTVEIQDGGLFLIRVTDNGSGIEREDIRNAFLRHSTSKIRKVEDLAHIASLGFRGEALSISAVTKTEVMTKTKEDPIGSRSVIEGDVHQAWKYRKTGRDRLCPSVILQCAGQAEVLKTPMTEAGHVQDLLMRLALSIRKYPLP